MKVNRGEKGWSEEVNEGGEVEEGTEERGRGVEDWRDLEVGEGEEEVAVRVIEEAMNGVQTRKTRQGRKKRGHTKMNGCTQVL